MASTHSFGLRAATLFYLLASTNALREGGQCKPNTFSALGCYVDGENGRALTGHSWQNEAMTTKACRRSCAEFQYFGVENGHECFCGDSLEASVAGPGECDLACGGNATETCGGVNRLNVYKNNAFGSSSSAIFTSAVPISAVSSSIAPSSAVSSSVASSEAISSSAVVISSSVPATPSETLTPAVPSPVVSSTSTPISSSVPTIASSTISPSSPSSSVESTTSTSTSTTSTTSLCPLATSVIVGDTPCWASMPVVCSSLLRTPAIPWPAVTAPAVACKNAFSAPVAIPSFTSASCFNSINSPNFRPESAYSCAQNAGVICATTTACATPTPAPTNVVVNGNFEAGSLSSWTLWNEQGAIGSESVVGASVTTGTAYSGRYALRLSYNNAVGTYLRQWKQDGIKLEPGATYAASYMFYQNFGQSAMKTKLQFAGGGGVALTKTFDHFNTAAGVWTKVTEQFVAAASFGTVYFQLDATRGGGPNTIHVDNISIQKVVV